jgi:hypothetical protein
VVRGVEIDHDTAAKHLLNGVVVPAHLSTEADLGSSVCRWVLQYIIRSWPASACGILAGLLLRRPDLAWRQRLMYFVFAVSQLN